MHILDNYKEAEKYKNMEDLSLEERVEFLEGALAQLMVKTAELSSTVNILTKNLGVFDNNPDALANIEEENKINAQLIEDFEVSKFKNDIKDL